MFFLLFLKTKCFRIFLEMWLSNTISVNFYLFGNENIKQNLKGTAKVNLFPVFPSATMLEGDFWGGIRSNTNQWVWASDKKLVVRMGFLDSNQFPSFFSFELFERERTEHFVSLRPWQLQESNFVLLYCISIIFRKLNYARELFSFLFFSFNLNGNKSFLWCDDDSPTSCHSQAKFRTNIPHARRERQQDLLSLPT